MCENDHLLKKLRYGDETFDVYKESLDFNEAIERCRCAGIPSRTLALIKTEDVVRYIFLELMNVESPKYWRIGLRKTKNHGTSQYVWLDGEVIRNPPDYMISGSGDCFNLYLSRNSAFLRPLQCEGEASHSGIFGYICSYNHTAAHTATTPSGNGDSALTSPQRTAILCISAAILLVCAIIWATLLLKRRYGKRNNKESNSMVPVLGDERKYEPQSSTEFGRREWDRDDGGSVGYATIDGRQIAREVESRPPLEDVNENAYSEIGGGRSTKDVYAVVNKKRSVVEANTSGENWSLSEKVTYAVVNKPKK